MLAPMPLAITLGAGSNAIPYTMPAVENINGQAITLAMKHRDKRNPRDWRGFRFAVPFDYSMHNYLLRYYLAEHGLDPDRDVQIRAVPPPEMVANLRADKHRRLSRPGPVQPARGLRRRRLHPYPVEGAVGRASVLRLRREPAVRHDDAEHLSGAPQIDRGRDRLRAKPRTVRRSPRRSRARTTSISRRSYSSSILTGTFADGLGNIVREPNRIQFDPFPWQSFAVWIMTQMKRWGQIRGDVDYARIASEVLPRDRCGRRDARGRAHAAGDHLARLLGDGKDFDPSKPEEYIASFPIRRT